MKKISYLTIIIALLISFTGCKKFLDINHDPDAIEEAPLNLILPAALSSPMYVIGGDGQVLGEFWAQHWTQSTNAPQFQGFDAWQVTGSTFDGSGFGQLYYAGLRDLEEIRKVSLETKNWTYYLIATSTQCYVYQMLADLYDWIPFTEALQGEGDAENGIEPNITPNWDPGEVVYDSLILRLDFAINQNFELASCEDPEEADIIFQGDIKKWVQFANTLKLKIALRQIKARPEVAKTILESINGADFLQTNACFDIFVNQSDKQNPAYATADVKHAGNITISRTLMNVLMDDIDDNEDVRDDRVYFIARKPASVPEFFRALYQGDFYNNEYASGIGQLSRPLLTWNDPLYYFTDAESYFLQAEAYLTDYWLDLAKAEEMYEKGVNAAFARFDLVNDTLGNPYSDCVLETSGYGSWGSAQNNQDRRRLIWTQKWISMANIQGLEAFIEHNRTNFPEEFEFMVGTDEFDDNYQLNDSDPDEDRGKFTISVNNVTNNRFPRRFMCPQSEVNGNPNTPSEIVNAQVYDPVWWYSINENY